MATGAKLGRMISRRITLRAAGHATRIRLQKWLACSLCLGHASVNNGNWSKPSSWSKTKVAIRAIASAFLKEAGYHVLETVNPEHALIIVKAHGYGISLLLTDVVMPGMSGRQLAGKVCAARPAIKVLYVSGYTDDVLIHQGVLEAGISILDKPFSCLSLLKQVRDRLTKA